MNCNYSGSDKKLYLIGESSWDEICFEELIGDLSGSFLHNDYFNESNRSNRKIIKRFFSFLKAFYFALRYSWKNRVYFSSYNMEVKLVAYLFFWNRNCYFFSPNNMGDPKEKNNFRNFLIFLLVLMYRNRFYVSDETSYDCLKSYGVNGENVYSFSIPDESELPGLIYVISLPAIQTHKDIKGDKRIYTYHNKLSSMLIERGRVVKLLPHPREEGKLEYLFDDRCEIIDSLKLSEFDASKICYMSCHSSLSLNRRYGGAYGCWVSIPGHDIFPVQLKKSKSKVVPIDYFID